MRALEEAIACLPERIALAVERYAARERIEEIRLRAFLPLSVTVGGENRMLDASGHLAGLRGALRASEEDVARCVSALCEGSVYRHAATLSRGYLVTPCGVRAGFCATTFSEANGEGRTSLSDFTGINLRIPHAVRGVSEPILEEYRRHGAVSTLVYSPPAAGKTTLLRDLALSLSAGAVGSALRVSVVDERGELFPEKSDFRREGGLLDVLCGRKKADGIELATRLLSPQFIVCDELGQEDEVHALLSAQHSGVLFACSAHANSRADLFSKPNIRALLEAGVFELLCCVHRSGMRDTELFLERVS